MEQSGSEYSIHSPQGESMTAFIKDRAFATFDHFSMDAGVAPIFPVFMSFSAIV